MPALLEYERPRYRERRFIPRHRFWALTLFFIPLLFQTHLLRSSPQRWAMEIAAIGFVCALLLLPLAGVIVVWSDRVSLTMSIAGLRLWQREYLLTHIVEHRVRGEIWTRERLAIQKAKDGSMLFLYWHSGVELKLDAAATIMIGSSNPEALASAINNAKLASATERE